MLNICLLKIQCLDVGYAEQLAQEDPTRFQIELGDFFNTYQYQSNGK
jgi:hypothetical protein